MQKKNFSLLVGLITTFLLSSSSGFCNDTSSISVVIPCINSHIKFLPRLLEELNNQTCLPSEVVISISSFKPEDSEQISQIENTPWLYHLRILKSSKRQFVGENRNIAIQNSKGELIIIQDADDLPHRQRVELIYDIYKKTNFDLLIHQYVKDTLEYAPHSEHKFRCFNRHQFSTESYDLIKLYDTDIMGWKARNPKFFYRNFPQELKGHGISSHQGNVAMKKKLLDSVQYNSSMPSGADVVFNREVVNKSYPVYYVNLPLVYYLIDRSSKIERESP